MATRRRGLISPRIQPGSGLTSEQPRRRLRAGRARQGRQAAGPPALSGAVRPGTARHGSAVPRGSPGCRRRPGAAGGAAGPAGQHAAATALSPPSTPRTGWCPRPLRGELGRLQRLHPWQDGGSGRAPWGSHPSPHMRPDTTRGRDPSFPPRRCGAGDSRPGSWSACVSGNARHPPGTGTGRTSRLGGGVGSKPQRRAQLGLCAPDGGGMGMG